MKWKLILTVLFSGLVYLTQAQNMAQTDSIARLALQEGEYELALRSFRRLIFFNPEGEHSYFNLYAMAECQRALGKTSEALDTYNRAYFEARSDAERNQASFSRVQLLMQNRDWNNALLELYQLESSTEASERRKDFYLGLCFFSQGNLTQADSFWSPLLDSSKVVSLREILYDKRLRGPNPTTAKVLSIVLPGSGQVYAGDFEAGLNSLILTSGLVAAAVYIGQALTPIDGIVSMAPWVTRYYIGGYNKAEAIALRENQKRKNEALNRILLLFSED